MRSTDPPSKIAVMGFVWGGLVATWMMAAVANPAVLSIYAQLFGVDFATAWGPAFTAPFTEEAAKFSGVVILVLLARRYVRSTYDGLILGAFVGLGFQVFENVQYIASGIEANFNQNPVGEALKVFIARSLTGFYTHAVFTAITGAALGYLINRKDKSTAQRWMVFVGLYVTAMVAHGLLDAAPEVPAFTLLSPVFGLGGLIFIWRYADREERDWVHDLMAADVEAGVLSQAELDVIAGKRKDRKRYLHDIKASKGKAAAKSADHVLEASYELATAIAATEAADSDQARHARSEVQRLRGVTT